MRRKQRSPRLGRRQPEREALSPDRGKTQGAGYGGNKGGPSSRDHVGNEQVFSADLQCYVQEMPFSPSEPVIDGVGSSGGTWGILSLSPLTESSRDVWP